MFLAWLTTSQTKMHLNNKNNNSAGLITQMGFLLWRFCVCNQLVSEYHSNGRISMLSQSGRKHLKTIRAFFLDAVADHSRPHQPQQYDGGTRRKRPALMWPLGVRRAFPHQFHQSNLSGLKQMNMYKVVGTGWCSRRILITQGLTQLWRSETEKALRRWWQGGDWWSQGGGRSQSVTSSETGSKSWRLQPAIQHGRSIHQHFTKSLVSASLRESHRLYGATSTCRHIVVLLSAVANCCFPLHSHY